MTDILDKAIAANLAALAEGLARGAKLAAMAAKAMRTGERNLAIGTVLPLEHELPTSAGLFATIVALHRKAGREEAP